MIRSKLAISAALLLLGSGLACGDKQCPDPAAPAPSAATASAQPSAQAALPLASAPPIRVPPACFKADEKVVVHVAIDSVAGAERSRSLWQINCSTKTSKCAMARVRLDHPGEIVRADVEVIEGAELSMNGQVATIKAGAARTFNVDFASRRVRLNDGDGAGETACGG